MSSAAAIDKPAKFGGEEENAIRGGFNAPSHTKRNEIV